MIREGGKMTYTNDGNLLDMVLEALGLLASILLGHVVRLMSEYSGMKNDQDLRCGVPLCRRTATQIDRNKELKEQVTKLDEGCLRTFI